ncbi:SpoIIE family protein phosphatase [Streptomyces sp. ACA25]|uniref:PP2C family protein-serine/threonine phosphatase n=1 Tax=Streptomyces sp. ACA25 TaxID=3022596 RepID=UPI002306FB1F|nr:SpoIIE family protein phosphatase [Streptomyces sp. ACA25]MDB1088555.1 SpoIIE family protein phosphatase [Streptomyces sp. ACA25]
MSTSEIDYASVFDATPSAHLLLGTDLIIADVNQAYLGATGQTRDGLIGRHIFDAFPAGPTLSGGDGARVLSASLQRVLETGKRDAVALQRYDIPDTQRPGEFQERWWAAVNAPVVRADGTLAWIIHRVKDATQFVRARRSRPLAPDGTAEAVLEGPNEALEAELFARTVEVHRLNEGLRDAHAKERHVALTLQSAMLRSPDLEAHEDIAVRYLPAVGTLNVCGDWYDVVDLSEGRFTVAVGDVVGHGLEAASIMGMLRSASSAAIRAVEGPAAALDVLERYARTIEEATATTVTKVVVDKKTRRITYSSAGHLPPILVRADGSSERLDQATSPPLGTSPEPSPSPEVSLPCSAGDVLVVYTDGLVERRGEDIDLGLKRLTEVLTEHRRLGAQALADTLLDRLGVASGAPDDVALVVIRL